MPPDRDAASMRAALLCALAAGHVRGAPFGQRSLDATLALIERDVAALEKMDDSTRSEIEALFNKQFRGGYTDDELSVQPGRCDADCTEGKYRTYLWGQKCNWVECKGCKECTPEGIEEDRRRHNELTEIRRRNEFLAAAGHSTPTDVDCSDDSALTALAPGRSQRRGARRLSTRRRRTRWRS